METGQTTNDDFDILGPEVPVSHEVKQNQAAIEPVPELPEGTNLLAIAAGKSGLTMTTGQIQALDEFMTKVRFGHQSAMPMRCKGDACPVITHCPLHLALMELPVGKVCPVEKSMINLWVKEALVALKIDPEDPDNAIDLAMAFELAGMELIRYRASLKLSDEPMLTKDIIVGYSPQGKPIYDEKPSQSLLILERQAKIIGRLREQLLATRRSQAQVGKISGDISVRGANMLSKARELAEKRRANLNKDAVDIPFQVKPDEQPK